MLIDGWLGFDAEHIAEHARVGEDDGYDALWAPETGHDPFVILAQAAAATERVELGTGIVVAFGRSPLITATMANDVQLLSKGRLLLGLGSQIKPHIEKRYSMTWSRPAARMREYILAMRAIWSCWNEGTPLAFRGEFYRHTLMTPFFSPEPNPYGAPKVFLAAVGELMTEVAGEVADGLLVHPFTTERYLREVTLPALERGLERAGRERSSYQISLSGMVVAGDTPQERRANAASTRRQIAFYASTPAYRGVLELHGWADLQPRLSELARAGQWEEMADLVDDEMLDTFCVRAPLGQVAGAVQARYGDVVDRFAVYPTAELGERELARVREGVRLLS